MNRAHGFNTLHGRMPSVTTGAVLANRHMMALGISGDGDTGHPPRLRCLQRLQSEPPGSDHEHVLLTHVAENALGERKRHRARGGGIGADRGLGTRPSPGG